MTAIVSVYAATLAVLLLPLTPVLALGYGGRHRRPELSMAGRVALVAALVWSVSLRPDWSVA